MVFPSAKNKSMITVVKREEAGRKSTRQWDAAKFSNWTKAADKLCQEKLHTPTHTTHIQFLLLKLALNVSWHSGAWGNATRAPAQCIISAQCPPTPWSQSITGKVSHRLPIKPAQNDITNHLFSTFRFCSPLACWSIVCTKASHTALYCQPWLITFSHPTPYKGRVVMLPWQKLKLPESWHHDKKCYKCE